MKIKIDVITKKGFLGKEIIGYRADFTELTGSPMVGTGKTEGAAVATLFMRNRENLEKMDWDYLEIDSKPYEDYIKYER